MQTNQKALLVTVFLVNVAIFALWYTVPIVISSFLHGNYALTSLLLSVVPAVEIIFSIPLGFYISNGGARKMGIIGTILLLCTPAIFVLFSGIGLLSTVLLGIGSITTEMSFGAYTFNITKGIKIRYIGSVFFLGEFGGVLGSAMGGYMLQYYNTSYMLGVIFVLLVAATLIFMRYVEPIRSTRKGKVMNLHMVIRDELKLAERFKHFVTSISIFSFMAGFFDWAIWLIIPLIIVIHSGNLFLGGLVYGVANLPAGFADFMTGRVYKKRSKRRLIIGSVSLSILLMLLMPSLLHVSIYVLALLFFVNFAIAVTYMAVSGFILERDRRDVAEFYTFETVSYDLGGILGTILAGVTVAFAGITTIAAIYAVMGAAFLLYFTAISKDVR